MLGELFSIKIMWPRTQAERGRKRNTGFVCFMNREDAEAAMEACNEADPFNVGRLLMMRWGKNVKKNVRQGTGGGTSIHPLQQDNPCGDSTFMYERDPDDLSLRTDGFPTMIEVKGAQENADLSKAIQYDPASHSENAIRVEAPSDPERFHFISTVASFVAKDGSQLEQRLIETERGNPEYDFLVHVSSSPGKERADHIFYRWRVYSFCQGDTFSNWRTEPFVMFHPNGRFWIPPPLDRKASSEEKEKDEERSESIRHQKDQRAERVQNSKELLTGRQIERARNNRRKGTRHNSNWDAGTQLSTEDRDRFNWLVRKKLTISRASICAAMAFCFEKSGAAQEIALLLKDTLMDDAPHVSVDMRIARLYLLSDILFNSQQPGVKNAFIYRDALEKMAPDIFTSLGRHGSGQIGRMTMNKLSTAVSTVLGAWTEWSVYNPTFLDELEARFAGKEIRAESVPTVTEETTETLPPEKVEAEVVIKEARGDWTEVAPGDDDDDGLNDTIIGVESNPAFKGKKGTEVSEVLPESLAITHGLSNLNSHVNGEDDLDGSPLDDLQQREGFIDTSVPNHHKVPAGDDDDDIDGDPIDEGIDGEVMDDGDAMPRQDPTSEHAGNVDDDIDGEALDDEGDDLDGVPLHDEEVGNDDLDGEELDDHDATKMSV